MSNIYDVAEKAKVSSSTVSRVINNRNIVTEEKRISVIKAIEELGYVPSHIARSMRSKILKNIGLIVPDIATVFNPRLIKGIEDYLYKSGYDLILTSNDNSSKIKIEDKISNLQNKQISGIIISSIKGDLEEKEVFKKIIENSNIPIVFVTRIYPDLKCSYVINNDYEGSYEATNYLIKLGHKKIALIYFIPGLYLSKQRMQGYLDALKDNNIKIDESLLYLAEDLSVECGYELGKYIINKKKKFSAIFCLTDVLAMGILKYCNEQKIEIPEEISIIGYDDIIFSSIISPPLTTVHQRKYKMGYEAAKLLISLIKRRGKTKKPTQRYMVLKPYLVVRNSAGAFRG